MEDSKIDEFYEWLRKGYDAGWVSDAFCYTHNGDPFMTEEEEKDWDDGGDPCLHVIKILL